MVKAKVIALFAVTALISAVDLGMNVVSFIPVVGDFLETASEAFLELLQLIFVVLTIWAAGEE